MSKKEHYQEKIDRYLKQIDEVIAKGPYKADWASLTGMEVPDWFRRAKFGIFIHWGLYSVPAFSNEWYSRKMYEQGTPEYQHHLETYGLHKEFGYKDFIPLFTADAFDPEAWADLFESAGAKYVVPVAEHHDGFQMYASELSDFNAVDMGPKRDIVGELKASLEKRKLLLGVSSHRAEHLWFMGPGRAFDSDVKDPQEPGDFYWPALAEQPEVLEDVCAKPYADEVFLNDWLVRTCELVDRYRPRILYFDWWIQHESYKAHLKKVAAYYYNRGLEWGTPTAICYKHEAMAFGSGIVDIERGKFADSKPYYWQTDTAIGWDSWCYTTDNRYKTGRELVCYLVDVVSKNGNLLLNIGPKADGSFAPEDAKALKEIGAWLKVNGEAVYGSKPWRFAQEGPTKEAEGKFSDGIVDYTPEDFRFTAGNGCIYAICMDCPADGAFTVKSLAANSDHNGSGFQGLIIGVEALGHPQISAGFRQDETGLHVSVPGIASDFPVVLKVRVK